MKATNEELDAIMKESGMTQTAISEKMGFSRTWLFEIRKNPSLLSLEQTEKMADILGVEFEVLQKIHQESRD